MRWIIRLLSFVSILHCFYACNPQPEAPALLAQAELFMESHPDSAMLLIDSIFAPEINLSNKQYMHYLVAKVRAKYKNHQNVSEDTLIFRARDYFEERSVKNPAQAALACFYSGCVYREQADYQRAMLEYKQADNYALQTTDSLLLGLIYHNMGDLLEEEDLYAEALEEYRKAKEIYRAFPEKQIYPLYTMGHMYALLEKNDTALVCYLRALELADSLKDRDMQDKLMQSLSITYREMGDYPEADNYLHQSFQLNTDTVELARYYLSFAKLYSAMGCEDSVAYYTKHLKLTIDSVTDDYLKASAYAYLSKWEKERFNYRDAHSFQDKEMDALVIIMNRRQEESVYEIQQKYNYEKIQNSHNIQLITRLRWIIFLLTISLLAFGGAAFLYKTVLLQKRKLLQTQEAIHTLKETAKDLRLSQRQLTDSHKSEMKKWREALLWKFDILKKSSQLGSYISNPDYQSGKNLLKRFEEIVYGENIESQWQALSETIEELNPGLLHFAKEHYPQFSETEFRVCLLSYAGLRAKEIALILNQSQHTVNMARSSIRKKMAIREQGADFCQLLKQQYMEQK